VLYFENEVIRTRELIALSGRAKELELGFRDAKRDKFAVSVLGWAR
jgi:hypothetical protein